MEIDIDDVLVGIGHPHGTVEVPLSDWMRTGPGERPLLRPVAARRRSTGERLPLSVIPLRYRNTGPVRLLIRAGLLRDPFPRPPGLAREGVDAPEGGDVSGAMNRERKGGR